MRKKIHKIDIIRTVIRANYELIDYKIYLKKLQMLKSVYIKLNLGDETKYRITEIEQRKKEIQLKMDKLRKVIEKRIHFLINIGKKKETVFCEVYVSEKSNTIDYQISSLTKYPINQLSTSDINRGYIQLTSVYIKRKKIILKELFLDLKTGELYDSEIAKDDYIEYVSKKQYYK